jgi:hypothetical protein
VTPVIRFQCERCGKVLAVQDSKAGGAGTCPGCKERFRIPKGGASSPEDDQDSGEKLAFSQWSLRKSMIWLLVMQLAAFVVMVCSPIGCVLIVLNKPMSFQMVLELATAGFATVAGFGFFFMALPNWRLFLFSTIPSSSHYLVKEDRLVRYSRGNKVVEEVPYANIADVRMLIRRDVENPEITAKVLGIDLISFDDRGTILDRQFCRWSQKVHRHDLVLTQDFFAVPLKTVYRTIKKRVQQWQETHPASAKEAPRRGKRSQPSSPYLNPLITYVVAGVGLAVAFGVACLASFFFARGKEAKVNTAPAESGSGASQVAGPIEQPRPAGPASPAGAVAYWPLDEAQGTAANDASGNGSVGRIVGGEWVQGVKGSAVRLGGKSDYVDLGSARQLNFGSAAAFTITGWVAARSNGVLCSFRRQASIFPIIELSVRQGRLAGWVRDDTSGFGGARITGGSVNDGAWHHVALVRQTDGTIELFLDGASQGSSRGKSSGGPITTDLRALGCDRYLMATGKTPGFLAGDLDDFCVYNRAFTAAEITVLAGRKQ